MKNLQAILSKIKELKSTELNDLAYRIPGLWINSDKKVEIVKPIDYFETQLELIAKSKFVKAKKKNLTESIIYNMMPRYTTAFEHFEVQTENSKEFKMSGTILKTIALLPYLKSLGTDILYLLPITAIGKYNKKGDLGSVYAVRNPYSLDENLSEDFLGLDVEIQFKALVEAAHQLGIKVVAEFIFRTASIDSDLAFTHPCWFYWIKEDKLSEYASPQFSDDELVAIKSKIEANDYTKLIAPSKEYKNLFTETPRKVFKEGDKYIGKLDNGDRCVIPGAFADWPPDDNQPIWSDVTYLKIFDNPKFNYIAYNTVRMYDAELNKTKYIQSELVEHITNVVPYYILEFDIDGIMLDMGHALPEQVRKAIINKSRKLKKNFIFFEENFIPNKESKNEKFDAVVGYLPFDFHDRHKMGDYIRRLAEHDIPIPCFATSENHNTPRLQSRIFDQKFSEMIWTLASFLPESIRFIHSGFELLMPNPVNTGLGFTDEQIAQFPSDELPLFSNKYMQWDKSIVEYIKSINKLRNELLNGTPISDFEVVAIEPYHQSVIAYLLKNKDKTVLICANFSSNDENYELFLPNDFKLFYNSISSVNFEVRESKLNLNFCGYEVKIGELK